MPFLFDGRHRNGNLHRTYAMTFNKACEHTRAGYPIRRSGWVEDIAIRWSWDFLCWQGRDFKDPKSTWFAAPMHPNPNEVLRNDWEVYDYSEHEGGFNP